MWAEKLEILAAQRLPALWAPGKQMKNMKLIKSININASNAQKNCIFWLRTTKLRQLLINELPQPLSR